MANDFFIWEKLKIGDKQSFELVFKMYYPQLCLFANQYTHNFNMAREVVQELFVYLWENRESLNGKRSIKSYIYTAIRHNSIRRFNGQKNELPVIEDIAEENLQTCFQDEIEFAELQDIIFTAISSLPPQCRKIFEMSRFDNGTYSQIADELNISPKTVETQMSKALKIIQKKFDDYLLFLAITFFL